MGPLQGVKVVELASIGPGPFCCMMLADMGADVVRVSRAGQAGLFDGSSGADTAGRGRSATIPVDLKDPAGVELVLRLCDQADALVEGMRPGVAERLGLGPDVVAERNPRLVYGRMTGYGQDGPMAPLAGHDINYSALSGGLSMFARRGERPLFPVNMLADYGGGGMVLAFGIVCGVLEARSSGRGQVVDAAMVEGAAVLTTMIHGLRAGGVWSDDPGTNALDSGAHFYEVYETSDGRFMAVGALEPQFYAELLRILEIDPAEMPQWDQARWPEFKERLAEVFRRRSRDEWVELFEPSSACTTAVYGLGEAPEHPHNRARGSFITVDGVTQPGPAPKFSRTAPEVAAPDPAERLAGWGLGADEIADLLGSPEPDSVRS